ncbi:MAG: alpha-amylase family glycosyl hydrolase [Lentisphaeria bacterium]
MAYLNKLSEDESLQPYWDQIRQRQINIATVEKRLTQYGDSLENFASGHEYYGLHKSTDGWIFREWAPNALKVYLCGDFNNWQESEEYNCKRVNNDWELHLPNSTLKHGQNYHLKIYWDGGVGTRIPSYARRVVQDEKTLIYSAQVWDEPAFKWEFPSPTTNVSTPLIYEAHIGMAQEKESVGTYNEFRENVLPRIVNAGYNVIQLMAIMEHPYYGSFGYHVSNFFAASSRFGTPSELKQLINDAHKAGLYVIMDIVHSHSVKNENEGLSCFDGTLDLYFHSGSRGDHTAWDSRCFNYGKTEVLHLLLSNCRYWLDEFKFDGFRFDGVTSMLYHHHGLDHAFTDYGCYFDGSIDADAEVYLALANKVIHKVSPHAITIAEDVSGLPGIASPILEGGLGFDYRLAMGIADYWYKMFKVSDELWNMDNLFYELTNHRLDEKTISYVESHDQAIVGDKTMIFELMDSEMYHKMDKQSDSLIVDRGLALHKMIRLLTLITSGGGYLNFMGNEFGHPEWIDFPREGNNWSYKYARRQWSLVDNGYLRFHYLADFDRSIIKLAKEKDILNNYCYEAYSHCDNHVLGIVRGDYFFIFNFHPSNSYSYYEIPVPFDEYEKVFSSDDLEFGGCSRISFGNYSKINNCIKIYIPSRCVLVLRRVK